MGRLTLLLLAVSFVFVGPVSPQETRAWPDIAHAPLTTSQSSSIALTPLFTIGSEDGSSFTFGFLTDVAQDSRGNIYALDPTEHRVAAFDSLGRFRTWIGRAGAGPGELLSPAKIEVALDTLIVYDRQLARISYFAASGRFVRSWQIQVPQVTSFAASADGTILVTVPRQDYRLFRYSRDGVLLQSYIRTPAIDRTIRGPYSPEPGATCAISEHSFGYANPWVYEVAAVDARAAVPTWAVEDDASTISPQASDLRGVSPVTQRAAILGLECGPGLTLFAYLDRRTSILSYDFIGPTGRLLARIHFPGPPASGYPGFLGSLRGGRLVTFRTKPFPQVIMYAISGLPSS